MHLFFRLWSHLDGHLGGGFLNFWPKWVINITKSGVQICSFWQNSRPLRPKMALIRGIIEIERAMFVLLALFWHMKRRCLGKAKSEGTFLHTHLYSNTRKEDFWSRETSKSTIWVDSTILPLERRIFEMIFYLQSLTHSLLRCFIILHDRIHF